MKRGKILVVDDNQGIRSALKILLSPHFSEVEAIASPKTLISTIERMMPQVVLLDMNFNTDINTGHEGLYWTAELKKMFPQIQIVLFTAYADIALAVEGMKRGAFDFIVKPWDNDKLLATLSAAYNATPQGERKSPKPSAKSDMYWGDSQQMSAIHNSMEKISPTDATVLITGENGTGKDVLAREIHTHSMRRQMPMVCVDAGAIPEGLFEGELFGYVKGAFTDAHTDHMGKFEQANGGTLFLDEIGNIPLHLQAKLLRVLQDRTVNRVGSERSIPIDIRLICATNADLEKKVEEGLFREDLFYRINTMHLHLPSLAERPNDIVPLAERFLSQYAEKYRRQVSRISDVAKQVLMAHPWNGNIRELQNVIEKGVILSDGDTLKASDLSLHVSSRSSSPVPTSQTLEEAEEKTIRQTMARCNGNLSMVAKELGISRPTLYSKLKKYGI
ncbi:MAG: sigma-54 dependent transcriptional regulator [Bacteroidia bacterium]|nr:sigma-54 dependent transcriptional regulator [Bacteroidia bacterium]